MKCLITENQSGNVVILSKGGEYQSKITESEIFKDWISASQRESIAKIISEKIPKINYGRLPESIVYSPEGHEDLYAKTKSKHVVKKISIDDVVQEDFSKPSTNIISVQEFSNDNSDRNVRFTAAISGSNTITVQSSWDKNKADHLDLDIGLSLEISGFKFAPTFKIGETVSHSVNSVIGKSDLTLHRSTADFTLKPKEKAIVELKNDEYQVNARIVYSISLSGVIFAGYRIENNNIHYTGVSIEDVMRLANIPNEIKVEQNLNISGYLHSNILFK
ncbi:hypothetical protein QE197_24525 (plasmid) [Arsenophonus nasoniae]|nr:hypothetical protein [Arsenophonus nasoniae]QBY46002.1 hypothetical protein ArsFIN_46130 [Arsenophonus nasoniae]WGM13675.1 hypothetical protein QE197_24525 [Arsenophonus nasoniae]